MNNFKAAAVRPGNLLPIVETPGFIVNEEITGGLLHKAFGVDEPFRINTQYAKIFAASDRYFGKPLLGMTEAKGKVIEIPHHQFRFTLSGGTLQRARITAKVCTDPRPGLYKSEFQIVVDKPFFNISDVIQPANNNFRLRVMHNHERYGAKSYAMISPNQYEYTIRLITDADTDYLPSKFIEEQAEWTIVSSAVANESNQDGGGIQFYSVFESEGQVQQHSRKVEVSDRAARMALQMAKKGDYTNPEVGDHLKFVWTKMRDQQSGEMKMFGMSLLEAKIREQLYSDVEDTLQFGKKSSSMQSAEGFTIYTASGLREHLESSWTLEHNGNMNLRQLEQFFDLIFRDRVALGQQKVVLSCGREFRRMFDQMVKADSSSFLTLDTMFIRKGESFRHLDYGSYFARYTGFTVDIDVMENAAYDNQHFCPQMHPNFPNIPVDSWRADILDLGMSSQKDMGEINNISMISEQYMNYRISSNGKWYSPWAVGTNSETGMPITDGGLGVAGGVSGFTLLIEKSAGLMVADPTRCAVIRLGVDSEYNPIV